MRYGKESIKWAISVSGHIGAEEIGDELDHVYAQAAKADEYEAKAKAYDRVTEKLYARIDHIIMTSPPEQCKPGYVDGLYNALDIINSELESGESD